MLSVVTLPESPPSNSNNSLLLNKYLKFLKSKKQSLSYAEWLRFAYNLIHAYKIQYQDKNKRHNDISLITIMVEPESFTFTFTTSNISSDNRDPITNLYPKKSYVAELKGILRTEDIYLELNDFSRLVAILHKSVPVELPMENKFEPTFFEKTAGFTVDQYLQLLKNELETDPKILKMIGVLEKYETESLEGNEDKISIQKSKNINTLKSILSDTTKNQPERLELFQEKLKESKSVFAEIRTQNPGCFSFLSRGAKSLFQTIGLFKTRGTQVAEELEAILQVNYSSKLRI